MAKKLISIDDSKTGEAALPEAVNAALRNTYGRAFPASQTIGYTNGNVTSVTEDGITTTYTYNADGTVDTDTRQGVTRKYTYTNGNLTKIEVQ